MCSATQMTCSTPPPYFRQILHASPLRMRVNLSETGLLSSQLFHIFTAHTRQKLMYHTNEYNTAASVAIFSGGASSLILMNRLYV